MEELIAAADQSKEEQEYFRALLTKNGWGAFERLCGLGCAPIVLSRLFLFLAAPDNIEFEGGGVLQLRPLDSKKSATNGLTHRQLKGIAQRAKRLRNECARLRESPLVQRLSISGKISTQDLLSPFDDDAFGVRFEGLLMLPAFFEKCGSKKSPDFTAILQAIFEHITRLAGGPNDALVADILNDLFPDRIDTQESLKQWRRQRRTRKALIVRPGYDNR